MQFDLFQHPIVAARAVLLPDMVGRIGHPRAVGRHVVVLVIAHVDVARRGVEVIDGVHHRTTAHAVIGLGLDVIERHIDVQTLFE